MSFFSTSSSVQRGIHIKQNRHYGHRLSEFNVVIILMIILLSGCFVIYVYLEVGANTNTFSSLSLFSSLSSVFFSSSVDFSLCPSRQGYPLLQTNGKGAVDAQTSLSLLQQNSSLQPRLLTPHQYFKLMNLAERVSYLLSKEKIKYTVAYGNALGSLLCHSALPWDDDVDVVVEEGMESRVIAAIRNGQSESDGFPSGAHLKYGKDAGIQQEEEIRLVYGGDYDELGLWGKIFFSKLGTPCCDKCNYTWPFVDVFVLNKTEIEHQRILPAVYRPYGRLFFPFPYRIIEHAKAVYGTSTIKCTSPIEDHVTGRKFSKRSSVECELLKDSYAFVGKRIHVMEDCFLEQLIFDGKIIQQTYVRGGNDVLNYVMGS